MDNRIAQDAAWCWWTRPRATRSGELLHVGAIESTGDIVALSFALDGSHSRSVLARVEPDDHNNPAILVREGRPTIAFYSRHDADEVVRYRIAADDTWADEQTIAFDGVTSYAQVHPVEDRLHLFTRAGVTTWSYATSPDWGASWQPSTPFIALDTDQEVYMPTVLLPDGHTLRVAIAGHPKEYETKPVHDVRVCTVDLLTGAISRPSSGEIVANLFDGTGLPLTEAQLELAFACPPDRTVNLYDVGDGPDFELGFGSKLRDDLSTTDARYHVTTLAGGVWATDDLGPAGGIFGYIHAGMYLGGLAFPHNTSGGRVAISREEQGMWHLDSFEREATGEWSRKPLIEPSTTRVVRPWAVTDPGAWPTYLALELERYDDSYFDTLPHLVAVHEHPDAR